MLDRLPVTVSFWSSYAPYLEPGEPFFLALYITLPNLDRCPSYDSKCTAMPDLVRVCDIAMCMVVSHALLLFRKVQISIPPGTFERAHCYTMPQGKQYLLYLRAAETFL